MKLTGNIPEIKRFETGLISFDYAFEDDEGKIGLPLGIVIEIFGTTGSGKSTLTYSLAGMLAEYMKGDIAVIDYEEFDKHHLSKILESVKFDKELYYINEDTDEEMMDELLSTMGDKKRNFKVAFVDGVGAISPVSEQQGEVGEANMGRRAKTLAQLSRRSRKIRRDSDMTKTFFLTNHALPVLGGRGSYAPGGETKNFMAKVRIRVKKKETFPDGSYIVEGKVIKNSFGYEQRIFYLAVVAGKGVHRGLTWFYDGFIAGIVKRGKTVKIGDTSIGYLKDIVLKAHHEDNNEFFEPFKLALAGINHTETDNNGIETNEGDAEDTEDTSNPSD